MDRQALVTAVFGAAIGALGCYLLVKRSWWRAIGALAIGGAALLNLVTEGAHSRGEDTVKFAATGILMALFVVACVSARRRSARSPLRQSGRSR